MPAFTDDNLDFQPYRSADLPDGIEISGAWNWEIMAGRGRERRVVRCRLHDGRWIVYVLRFDASRRLWKRTWSCAQWAVLAEAGTLTEALEIINDAAVPDFGLGHDWHQFASFDVGDQRYTPRIRGRAGHVSERSVIDFLAEQDAYETRRDEALVKHGATL